MPWPARLREPGVSDAGCSDPGVDVLQDGDQREWRIPISGSSSCPCDEAGRWEGRLGDWLGMLVGGVRGQGVSCALDLVVDGVLLGISGRSLARRTARRSAADAGDFRDRVDSPWRRLFRILTFRFDARDTSALGPRDLIIGLAFTWLAGVGRYWDHPDPHVVQRLGVGSLVYIFVLSGILSAVTLPLKPVRWSYRHILTFVALTAPPALLYAVPVERWTELSTAGTVNAWFLGVVAAWRVGLYGRYLRVHAGLGWFPWSIALLLPLVLIVVALSLLNLEHAVFNLMAGITEPRTPGDLAYRVVLTLGLFSVIAFGPLLIAYVAAVFVARKRRARVDPPATPGP